MAKLFPPMAGSADPMGPEPVQPGRGYPRHGTMFKFQYDPANTGTVVSQVYADAAERNADARLTASPNGTQIVVGSAVQVKVNGAWVSSAVMT